MIKVYTTKECLECVLLKHKLMLLRITFLEIDIEEDDDARVELIMRNILSTPVIEVDGMFFELRE